MFKHETYWHFDFAEGGTLQYSCFVSLPADLTLPRMEAVRVYLYMDVATWTPAPFAYVAWADDTDTAQPVPAAIVAQIEPILPPLPEAPQV